MPREMLQCHGELSYKPAWMAGKHRSGLVRLTPALVSSDPQGIIRSSPVVTIIFLAQGITTPHRTLESSHEALLCKEQRSCTPCLNEALLWNLPSNPISSIDICWRVSGFPEVKPKHCHSMSNQEENNLGLHVCSGLSESGFMWRRTFKEPWLSGILVCIVERLLWERMHSCLKIDNCKTLAPVPVFWIHQDSFSTFLML